MREYKPNWARPFHPWEYWADLAEEEPDFLIEGMLHATTNTVSGKPTVGKTRLVAAMAAAIAKGDEQFCGSQIVEAGPVMIVSTDAGETRRWGLRMREHGVPDSVVAIAKYDKSGWPLYENMANGARLFILDNITGALGSATIGADDAARQFTEPLANIAENGTTVVMIAHSAKNFEAQSGHHTPKGPMGSTVYQAWERLNLHMHDVTEPNVRNVLIRSNDHADRNLMLEAKWGRASAEWALLSETEDTRNRTEEVYEKRNELASQIVGDPQLACLSQRRLAKALGLSFSTVQRSLKAGGAEWDGTRWVIQ